MFFSKSRALIKMVNASAFLSIDLKRPASYTPVSKIWFLSITSNITSEKI
jgi:hypothetical protein